MITTLIAKLHPLVVHFPIALILTALAFAIWSKARGGPIKHAIPTLLLLGAVSATFAVLSGWFLADLGNYFGSAAQHLLLHRWVGVGTASVAILLAMLLDNKRGLGALAMGGLVIGGLAVSVTGHLGGELVFGEDHFVLEGKPKRARQLTDPAGEKRVVRDRMTKVPDQVSYAHVQPLLRRSCLRCHDARKRKGDLRLDRKSLAMAGGESGEVIVPGDAKGSKLFQVISLPQDHEDYMPSKGDPLSEIEVAVIGRWIDQGADWPE